MKSKLIIVALSTVLIAAPASAKGTDGDSKADKNAAASVDTKKYCIQYDSVVGTRVARTQCLTKDEWKKQHVDVDRMLNQ